MDDQQWIIVNLDKREIYGGGAQLGKLFFSRLPAYLSRDMRTAVECHPPSATPPSDTDLESMDITEAMINLILHPIEIPAPWSGDRIICIGSDLTPDDLPPHLALSAAERAELACVITTALPDRLTSRDYGLPKTLYNLATRTYTRHALSPRAFCPSMAHHPDARAASAERAAHAAAPFVLRNRSRRTYVLGSTLAERGELRGVPLSFAHVVLARACWSKRAPDGVCRLSGAMHRGVWAGDAFDVIREEEWGREQRLGWADVSWDAVEEALGVWLMSPSWWEGPERRF